MGRSIREAKNMKDFSNYNIPEFMGVSTDELQELSFEEFGNELDGKKINICPISENGDIVIGAMNADILIKLNQRTITIFEHDSHIHIDLTENIIFVLNSLADSIKEEQDKAEKVMEDDDITMDASINFLAKRQTVVEEPPKKQMSLRERLLASKNKSNQ